MLVPTKYLRWPFILVMGGYVALLVALVVGLG